MKWQAEMASSRITVSIADLPEVQRLIAAARAVVKFEVGPPYGAIPCEVPGAEMAALYEALYALEVLR
jgi:hypothetical protein